MGRRAGAEAVGVLHLEQAIEHQPGEDPGPGLPTQSRASVANPAQQRCSVGGK